MNKIKKIFEIINLKYKKYKKNKIKCFNSRKLKAFYINGKRDKRSELAQIIDYTLWRLGIFFLVFVRIYIRRAGLYLSVFSAVAVVSVYHVFSIQIRNEKMMEFKKEKRKEIANQRVYKEILNKTVEEIREYMIELFTKIGFKDIKYISNDHKSILLQGMYNKNEVMIYYIYKKDLDVELKDLKEFLLELIKHNIKKAIFITTSDFTQDCYRFLKELNDSYTIILVNKDMFLSIIEGNAMFPTENEIDEIIESKIIKKNKSWKRYKATVLSNNKRRGYLLLTIYLAITGLYMPYTIYYMIVSSITLFLFIATFILNFRNQDNKNENSWESIENLFENL